VGHKLKIILSDLHIGAGNDSPLEDFAANQAFANFLHTLWHESEESHQEIELIINGDLFEFLQVPAVDNFDPTAIYPKERYRDTSETASIQRLNIIADGHPDIFNALADFIHVEAPQRRITIIKGSHDVHLFWPGVKNRLREILGASGTRASLLRFANDFISREKIYVEHGHQRVEKFYSFPDSYDPRSPDDPGQLYLPPSSQFVIETLNPVEPNWWFIDNIKPFTALIWYALLPNFDFAGQGLANIRRYLPAAGQEATPLLADLESGETRQTLSQQYRHDLTFRRQLHQQIHHYLLQAHKSHKDGTGSITAPQISDNPLEMGLACQKQQQTMLYQAAEKIAKKEGAQIVLFGHTHHPVQESLRNGSHYINTGSWIENIFAPPPETLEALFANLNDRHQHLSRFPYARIEYEHENGPPVGRLLYFDTAPAKSAATPAAAAESPKGFFEKKLGWLIRLLQANN